MAQAQIAIFCPLDWAAHTALPPPSPAETLVTLKPLVPACLRSVSTKVDGFFSAA